MLKKKIKEESMINNFSKLSFGLKKRVMVGHGQETS